MLLIWFTTLVLVVGTGGNSQLGAGVVREDAACGDRKGL